MSIVVNADLQRRLRAEAGRHGKSVSRFVREILEERVPSPQVRHPRRSSLLKLCGLAHGELAGLSVDDELYGR